MRAIAVLLLLTFLSPNGVAKDRGKPACALMQSYAYYNAAYFNNSLPKNMGVFWKKHIVWQGEECLALTLHTEDHRTVVLIDRKFRKYPAIAELWLLHEMAHMSTGATSDESPLFQAEMQRLAAAGAFAQLW